MREAILAGARLALVGTGVVAALTAHQSCAAPAGAWAAPVAARAAASGQQQHHSIRAQVVGVTDGDTVTILVDGLRQVEVRLAGIDAPETSCHRRRPDARDEQCVETGQAFGRAAKKHLSALVYWKAVTVEIFNQDRYGRTIARVFADGLDANLEQIRAGYAWHYVQYQGTQSAGDRELYARAEHEARASRRGLWADSSPVPPWDFRHQGPARRASPRP